MSLNSESRNKKAERPWLEEVRQKRSKRSIELGVKAIDQLILEKKEVTYSNIVKKTKELDPTDKGIHPNTIRSNSYLYNYYVEHSISFKKRMATKSRRRTQKEMLVTPNFWNIKIDRDIKNVRKRYRNMSKEQLINRLIQAEQFIACELQNWVTEQFRSFPKE